MGYVTEHSELEQGLFLFSSLTQTSLLIDPRVRPHHRHTGISCSPSLPPQDVVVMAALLIDSLTVKCWDFPSPLNLSWSPVLSASDPVSFHRAERIRLMAKNAILSGWNRSFPPLNAARRRPSALLKVQHCHANSCISCFEGGGERSSVCSGPQVKAKGGRRAFSSA